MNLKEAFRYQNFLESLMSDAHMSICSRDHCLRVSNNHLRSKANPDAEDEIEIIERGEFYYNDDVIQFMLLLVDEKGRLSEAIASAKESIGFNIDAALETNKFRQKLVKSIKSMLSYKSGKRKMTGRGYRFDVNQVQVPYIYDVEVTEEEDFDRAKSKAIVKEAIGVSDAISMDIETAFVNTQVNYTPPFDVNSSFEDVMQEYAQKVLENSEV